MKKIFTKIILLFTLISSLQAQNAPIMSVTDIIGKKYTIKGTEHGLSIKGLEGKVIFLEFFGHRCPPCLATIPHFIDIKKQYKEKLAIIAIEVQGLNNNQLKTFANQKGINYITIAQENASILIDYIQQRAQWRGSIPFLVAMDTKGNVQFVQAGMIPEISLKKLIEKLK